MTTIKKPINPFTSFDLVKQSTLRLALLAYDSLFYWRRNPRRISGEQCILIVVSDLDRQINSGNHSYCQHLDFIFSSYENIICVSRYEYRKSIDTAPYPVAAYPRYYVLILLVRLLIFISRKVRGKDLLAPVITHAELCLWQQVLNSYKPSLILSICASRELCLEAHRSKVPLIEFSHSEINDRDYKYEPLYRINYPSSHNADWYYVWSESSKATLSQWHTPNRILVGPSPSFMKRLNISLPESTLPLVLVTLQYGVNHSLPGFMRAELIELIRSTKHDCCWLIMPHPNHRYYNQVNEIKHSLELQGVNSSIVCQDSTPHLPSYLHHVKYHITEYSGSAIESLHLKINTSVLNSSFYEILYADNHDFRNYIHPCIPSRQSLLTFAQSHKRTDVKSTPGILNLKNLLVSNSNASLNF